MRGDLGLLQTEQKFNQILAVTFRSNAFRLQQRVRAVGSCQLAVLSYPILVHRSWRYLFACLTLLAVNDTGMALTLHFGHVGESKTASNEDRCWRPHNTATSLYPSVTLPLTE